MKKTSKRGFTMLEMLLAMLATAILAVTVGAMLYYAWIGWRNNSRSVDMQRDAVLAMDRIAREIRTSNILDISSDNAGIYFDPVVARTNTVNITTADIAVFPGVNIRNFSAQKNGNAVTVGFTLFTDGDVDQNAYSITVNTRN